MQALEASSTAISEVNQVVGAMNPRQRLLFESIIAGDDELISTLKAGYTEWFTGITKVVETQDGEHLKTTDVTLTNVHTLQQESYQRLLRICRSRVSYVTGTEDYKKYLEPIREYIKRYTPMALGTIVNIARDGVKEENRLKAAINILDRAGEREPEPEKDVIVPVQVNIMLTEEGGHVRELR